MKSYVHPGVGFRIAAPQGWTVYEDAGDCAVAVVRDEPHPVFRPNLTIAVERHDLVRDADAWVDAQVNGLAHSLVRMQLIDRAPATVGGLKGRRVVANHEFEEILVTVEQWLVAADGMGYVLTASMWGLDFGWQRRDFADIVDQFRPEAGAA